MPNRAVRSDVAATPPLFRSPASALAIGEQRACPSAGCKQTTVQYRSRRPGDSLHMFPEQVDPGGTKNGPAGGEMAQLIWRPRIRPSYRLVRRLDIRAAHRFHRSNERFLARHNPDRESIRNVRPAEGSLQRGRIQVVRSIDRFRIASGASPVGVNHLILCERDWVVDLLGAGTGEPSIDRQEPE